MQYFLNGVARQSEDALSRAERLNQLLANWRDQLSGQAGTKVALQLLDMIAANPFLTPRAAEAGFHTSTAASTEGNRGVAIMRHRGGRCQCDAVNQERPPQLNWSAVHLDSPSPNTSFRFVAGLYIIKTLSRPLYGD